MSNESYLPRIRELEEKISQSSTLNLERLKYLTNRLNSSDSNKKPDLNNYEYNTVGSDEDSNS